MPIFAIIMGALWSAISWLFKAVIIKFIVFTALFLVLKEVLPMLMGQLTGYRNNTTGLTSSIALIPEGIWYFMSAFRLDIGIPAMLSAYASRFLIRRLPLVG